MLTTSADPAIAYDRQLPSLLGELLQDENDSLEHGRTLPPQAYTSQEFYDLEVQALFKAEWNCIGHVSQVANVGDYFTYTLLGERLLCVRGKDRVRVLSGVCRHRWAPVATGSGNTPAFSCPFHKWTYALDGALIGAPLMQMAEGFDKSSCRLPEIRSEIVEELGLIFVTFAGEIDSIDDRLASLRHRARSQGWDLKDQVVVDVEAQTNNYNWKAQAETYAECYHHLGGHETTIEKAVPAAQSSCEDDKGTWTICHARLTMEPKKLNELEMQVYDAFAAGANPGDVVLEIVIIYPLTLLTVMKTSCDVRLLQPLGPASTQSTTLVTVRRDHSESEGFPEWLADYIHGTRFVNDEDNTINLMQQVGVSSSFAAIGRFSHLEGCAFHLAQYVRKRINAFTSDRVRQAA